MQMIIKGARQCCPDSAHRLEVVDTGPKQSLHAAEVTQERSSLGRTQSRHGFEHRFVVTTRAALAMSGDREAMCFVANALDYAQPSRIRARDDRTRIAMHDQAFLAGLSIRPLRHAHELETGKSQLFELDVHLVD